MVKGTVKFFNNMKNYGFIEREGENEEDVFIHKSELPPDANIEEGTELEFEIEQGDQGPRAVQVEILE